MLPIPARRQHRPSFRPTMNLPSKSFERRAVRLLKLSRVEGPMMKKEVRLHPRKKQKQKYSTVCTVMEKAKCCHHLVKTPKLDSTNRIRSCSSHPHPFTLHLESLFDSFRIPFSYILSRSILFSHLGLSPWFSDGSDLDRYNIPILCSAASHTPHILLVVVLHISPYVSLVSRWNSFFDFGLGEISLDFTSSRELKLASSLLPLHFTFARLA